SRILRPPRSTPLPYTTLFRSVAGVAAMLFSYFPELTAAQVKQIIMDSGVSTNIPVILGGEPDNQRPFSEISKSGKMVNMYNAFLDRKSTRLNSSHVKISYAVF